MRSLSLIVLALASSIGVAQEICQKGGSGTVLPLIPGEYDWDKSLRAVLYLLGLLWAFLGVGIIADTFMAAIEVVTSQETVVTTKTGASVPVKIWNATVANLTLMALGSSAPEILLNVIEIIGNGFFAGELGPSTIVGSAAFNLLIIIAVCVVAIPPSVQGGKKIEGMDVYVCTASFSVFAYVWLVVILMLNTPNRIDTWEAIVTFLCFPVLVLLAWGLDEEHIRIPGLPKPKSYITQIGSSHFHPFEIEEKMRELEERYKDLPKEQREELIVKHLQVRQKPSRAQYRMMAMRNMTGGKRIHVPTPTIIEPVETSANTSPDEPPPPMEINFKASGYSILESAGKVTIQVVRSHPEGLVTVHYSSEGVTANAGEDYVEVDGTITFRAGELEKTFTVDIIDDDEPEEDEMFIVKLDSPQCNLDDRECVLGTQAMTIVTIIDDDDPGVIGFKDQDTAVSVRESEGVAIVRVNRFKGSSGTVTVDYETSDITATGADDETAKNGDYINTRGTLTFNPEEMNHEIRIPLIDRKQYDKAETFKLRLFNVKGPTEKAQLAPLHNCIVTIVHDAEMKSAIDRVTKILNINADKYSVGTSSWKQQFMDAITVGGGDSFDDVEGEDPPPSTGDYVMHFITLPWKLVFATCPPTDYANGWFCFVIALVYIGGVTALIGDLANLFGCVIGLESEITAITLVALGTSLPDTFASKTAAQNDDNADASIGNVTGSNSVNVFLGLGLPWTIAAIYWQVAGKNSAWLDHYGAGSHDDDAYVKDYEKDYPNGGFIVPAGSLGISVVVFTICALCAIATLALRRKVVGSELGGPAWMAWGTFGFFIFLWFVYIIVSILVIKEVV